MSPVREPNLRLGFASAVALVLVHLLAPWPLLQAPVHGALVLGFAPGFHSRLAGVLWASAGGWVLESGLRMMPQAGGMALANMTVALALSWSLEHWPPAGVRTLWVRLAAFAVLHVLLAHALVRMAAGPHVWGWGWLAVLATVPLWGTLAFRWHRPFPRR